MRVIADTHWLAALGVLWCLGAPLRAAAGGLEVGDISAEAMGRGGAFVAKADSPAALTANPAGFAKLGGHQALLSVNAMNCGLDFQRSGPLTRSYGPSGEYPVMSNTKPWFVMPLQFVLTTDLGLSDRFTFAAGVYGPPSPSRSYERTLLIDGQEVAAPQRYDAVATGGIILFPTVALAYRVNRYLDVGASFQWVVTKIHSTSIAMVQAACPESSEDPACDVSIKVDAQDLFAPTGSAGILVRPLRGLEIGTMVRLPSTAELTGKAQVEFGPAIVRLAEAMQEKILDPMTPSVALTNRFPWVFRVGARYVWYRDGDERADIEADVVSEKWASASSRTIQIDATSLGKPLAPLQMDWKLRDTYGARLGGSYRFRLGASQELVVRLGALYESETAGVSDTTLSVLAPRRAALTTGLGVVWGPVRFDVAYAHWFLPTRVVENSSRAASELAMGIGPIVGNGTYRTRLDALYLQLTGTYGRAIRPLRSAPVERPVIEEDLRPRPRDDEPIEIAAADARRHDRPLGEERRRRSTAARRRGRRRRGAGRPGPPRAAASARRPSRQAGAGPQGREGEAREGEGRQGEVGADVSARGPARAPLGLRHVREPRPGRAVLAVAVGRGG